MMTQTPTHRSNLYWRNGWWHVVAYGKLNKVRLTISQVSCVSSFLLFLDSLKATGEFNDQPKLTPATHMSDGTQSTREDVALPFDDPENTKGDPTVRYGVTEEDPATTTPFANPYHRRANLSISCYDIYYFRRTSYVTTPDGEVTLAYQPSIEETILVHKDWMADYRGTSSVHSSGYLGKGMSKCAFRVFSLSFSPFVTFLKCSICLGLYARSKICALPNGRCPLPSVPTLRGSQPNVPRTRP